MVNVMKQRRIPRSEIVFGAVLFLAVFTAINLAGERLFPRFDANQWWIVVPGSAGWVSEALLAIFALLTIAFCAKPRMGTLRRRTTLAMFSALGCVASWNALQFATLLLNNRIQAGFAVPLSLGIAVLLFSVVFCISRQSQQLAQRHWIPLGAGFIACGLLFPTLQMICFGKTDYRRSADAVVILGARAYADGRLSDALQDRVRTACDLYHQGLVRKLIMSGGPGDGAIHETEAMKRFAIGRGVSEQDILLDAAGLNTAATVKNTTVLFDQHGIRRVLVVSHFYHLPRVKLTYQRAGWEVYTVPAQSERILGALPLFMAREIAALGKYYFAAPNS